MSLIQQLAKAAAEKEAKRGLWDNVHAKRKRGEKPAKKGDKDYPDEKSWKKTTKEAALKSLVLEKIAIDKNRLLPLLAGLGVYGISHPLLAAATGKGGTVKDRITDLNAYGQTALPAGLAGLATTYFTHNALNKGKDGEEEKSAALAWQRKAGKNSEGGLNAKGRASYNKATGGNLKAPVTSKKPKGKAKKRKASFCARMGGMKKKNTSKATANDPDSRINKSLRKWNC